MRELANKNWLYTQELTGRTVTLFLSSNFLKLSGNFYWDFASDQVFCSDVMFTFSTEFPGVRGIVHPDDIGSLKEKLQEERIDNIEFRIITTYGEVRSIAGNEITVEPSRNNFENIQQYAEQDALKEIERSRNYEQLLQIKEVYEKSERYANNGIWWYNDTTNETWYSAQVFRIYDLPPHSLNAHLNTFAGFIHPEDQELVNEFTSRAYKKKLPLHIEYRINTPAGEKQVQHISYWIYNSKGESVLSGMLQDITEQRKEEQRAEQLSQLRAFYKQQIQFDEQTTSIAHWHVRLLTRKTVYSDHYYRLFGLRPNAVPSGLSGFINYIHPEDRENYSLAHKKMIYEHQAPELEFRIIRTDGKLRYISQKAKLITYDNEMVMTGTIQDITVQRVLEKKIKELSEKESIRDLLQSQTEEMGGIGSWIMNVESGVIKWSDNVYRLLGYKGTSVEISLQAFQQFLHPEDQKKFSYEITLFIQQQQKIMEKRERKFEFRLIQRGAIRYIRATLCSHWTEDLEMLICTMQDITSEFALQARLKERIQIKETLFSNILDRIIFTDIDHSIVLWSKACEEAYHISKEEAIGRNFFDVFPRLKSEEHLKLFTQVMKGEPVSLHAQKSILGSGYFDLLMKPMWDEEHNEVSGIIHIIHDVTREMELRKALNERLIFIESLVESSVDRIIAMDRNLNYLIWNKKCEEYYGLKKEGVIGKNVLEIFPEASNTPSYEQFRRVLKGETIHIVPEKDTNEEYHHETYLIPVKNGEQDIAAILWIQHDLAGNISRKH